MSIFSNSKEVYSTIGRLSQKDLKNWEKRIGGAIKKGEAIKDQNKNSDYEKTLHGAAKKRD